MRYAFGDYELDDQLYELRHAGESVELERKVYDVLAYLIQHRDRLVTKDELLDKLWPGQVVGEAALTRCITSARKALGDDGNRQEFIKTQYGRGYRFVAAVVAPAAPVPGSTFQVPRSEEVVSSQHSVDINQEQMANSQEQEAYSLAATSDSPALPAHSPTPSRSHRRFVFLLGLLLLTSLVIVAEWRFVRSLNAPSVLTADSPALPLPDKPSIIVLPFTNLSGDPGQEYFSDGLTDDLITDLSRIPQLFVIAHHSAFSYKGKQAKVQEVSREMGVRYVLEGSVRRAEGRVRITTQLSDATTGEQLWAERYERPLQDIFALQDEIRGKIALALKVKLTPEEQERFKTAPTNNLEAYDYYLRGWQLWLHTTKETNIQARQMFEKALELDPQYAGAYAGLGATYWIEWLSQWSADPQNLARAEEMFQQAIVLDESLSRAHAGLGFLKMFQKQYEQATAEIERALALDPNSANGYRMLAYVLMVIGRTEEAVEAAKKAVRLGPRQVQPLKALGEAYWHAGQYEEAIPVLKQVLTYTPSDWLVYWGLAVSYSELGREEEAWAAGAEMLRLVPQFSIEKWKPMAPYKDPAVTERIAAAARKAGLK